MQQAELKFKEICSYPILASVGQPVDGVVTQVNDWTQATTMCTSQKWERCIIRARNALQRSLETRYWERLQEWGPIADLLRPQIVSFVGSKVPNSSVPSSYVKTVSDQVAWDILFICLEYGYRDIVPPMFYVPFIDPWYALGHFPCGWEGQEIPENWDRTTLNGRMVIF